MINVGDRVKCIDVDGFRDVPCPLILDNEYIVSSVGGCCVKVVTIGIKVNPFPKSNDCRKCGFDFYEEGGEWRFRASRFVKVEEQKQYQVVEVSAEIKKQKQDLVLN